MKPFVPLPIVLATIAALALPPRLATAQHLNAGALGTHQDSRLFFSNGDAFIRESGYVGRMVFTNGGTYAGYYGFGLSPTALPATIAHGGPVSNAPAVGSFIKMRFESITGPTNGAIAFWDTGSPAPTVVARVGDTEPSALFSLSDASLGAGRPGADPYGHMHGRRFTLNQAGKYTVGFRIFDTSTNGAGYGPIHRPSDVLHLDLNTVVSLSMKGVQRTNGNSVVTFHQGGITNVVLEASGDLHSNLWTVVAGPFANAPFGPNSTTTIVETNTSADRRVYRLRGVAP